MACARLSQNMTDVAPQCLAREREIYIYICTRAVSRISVPGRFGLLGGDCLEGVWGGGSGWVEVNETAVSGPQL